MYTPVREMELRAVRSASVERGNNHAKTPRQRDFERRRKFRRGPEDEIVEHPRECGLHDSKNQAIVD